ncbi:hypothetical protein QTP88_029674 [Uroleucon formosanum]
MTQDLLQQIIEQLHNVGFNVIAMVSDMGSSNIGLWKALNIHIENTSFKHKITNQNIYVFADVPHLLKLARNHLIVKGFVLSKGKYIGKGVFEELVNLNSGQDYKLAHKFTKKHLLVEGTGLMKVKLAAELFLYTASEIILLFNDWFDLLNTQHKFDKRVKSYGLNESNQNDLLEKMNSFIKSTRVHKKNLSDNCYLYVISIGYNTLFIGILVTNISLKNLLIDIKNMNGLTYTMTRKLNQDILENLFSFLKGMAGCASNNITASDFKCCLRWFILGKHSHSVFSENTNIEDGHKDKLLNDSKCITSDLFYNLKLSEEICKDQLETESHNTCLKETDIPELHFDLLKQFEDIIIILHTLLIFIIPVLICGYRSQTCAHRIYAGVGVVYGELYAVGRCEGLQDIIIILHTLLIFIIPVLICGYRSQTCAHRIYAGVGVVYGELYAVGRCEGLQDIIIILHTLLIFIIPVLICGYRSQTCAHRIYAGVGVVYGELYAVGRCEGLQDIIIILHTLLIVIIPVLICGYRSQTCAHRIYAGVGVVYGELYAVGRCEGLQDIIIILHTLLIVIIPVLICGYRSQTCAHRIYAGVGVVYGELYAVGRCEGLQDIIIILHTLLIVIIPVLICGYRSQTCAHRIYAGVGVVYGELYAVGRCEGLQDIIIILHTLLIVIIPVLICGYRSQTCAHRIYAGVGVVYGELYAVGRCEGLQDIIIILHTLLIVIIPVLICGYRSQTCAHRIYAGVGVVYGELYAVGRCEGLQDIIIILHTLLIVIIPVLICGYRSQTCAHRIYAGVGVVYGELYAVGRCEGLQDIIIILHTLLIVIIPVLICGYRSQTCAHRIYAGVGVVYGELYAVGRCEGLQDIIIILHTLLIVIIPVLICGYRSQTCAHRIYAGVGVVYGELYAVGRCEGLQDVIIILHTLLIVIIPVLICGYRSQTRAHRIYAGVGVVYGELYAVGRCEGLNRLSSVEYYRPTIGA